MKRSYANGRLRQTLDAAAGQASEALLLPPRYESITVGAVPGSGGQIRVEFTLDDPEDVEANPDAATWYVWDDGNVGVPTVRVLDGALTGVRGVATAQSGSIDVVARFDR